MGRSKLRYRLALFDFDGTLADSFPFFASIMNTLADKHHFRRIGADEIDTLRALDAKSILRKVGVPLWKLPAVGNSFKAMMAQNIDQIHLFPGVPQMLQRLSASGVKIAILTSNAEENVKRVLGAENARLVDFYQCGVSMFGKSAKIRHVLRQTSDRREAAILIGDEVRDAHAATSEGVAFGAVSWGYTLFDALIAESPKEAFRTVDEIADCLLQPL